MFSDEQNMILDLIVIGGLAAPLLIQLIDQYHQNKKYNFQLENMRSPSMIPQPNQIFLNEEYEYTSEEGEDNLQLKNLPQKLLLNDFTRTIADLDWSEQAIFQSNGDFLEIEFPLKGKLVSDNSFNSLSEENKQVPFNFEIFNAFLLFRKID